MVWGVQAGPDSPGKSLKTKRFRKIAKKFTKNRLGARFPPVKHPEIFFTQTILTFILALKFLKQNP
jgi:hypothetical protein